MYHADAGATFSYAASSPGAIPYACAPHSAMGMRGVLVVGMTSLLGLKLHLSTMSEYRPDEESRRRD